MVPWLVAVLTLIPLYKILFLYSRGLPQQEWFTYFHFFQRAGGDPAFYADSPSQGWLWFLPVLFLFQVVYVALARTKLLSIKISFRNAVILVFILGLLYSMIISNTGLMGWYHSPILHFQNERLAVYFLLYLLGTLSYKLNVLESDKPSMKYYIVSNVVLTISLGIFTVVALNLFFNMIDPQRDYYFVSPYADRIFYFSTMLLSMLGFLHVLVYAFRRWANKSNWLFSELSKNSYSVYITHMVVIGFIALPLLNTSLPAIVKFMIVTIMTYAVSNLLASGYRKLLKKTLSGSIVSKAVAPAAILMVISIYVAMGQSDNSIQICEEKTLEPPEVSIHEAAMKGDTLAIRQHIAAGTNLDEREPSGGSSALITASLFGKIEVARLLVEAGTDVNLQNNDGSTALHTAVFFCHPEIVKLLIESGADRSIRNNAGSTALVSVSGPFEQVKGIYDYFGQALGPLGLELDYDHLRETRPLIAKMLESE